MSLAEQLSVSGLVRRPEFEQEAQRAIAWGARALEREGRPVELPAGLAAVVWRLLQDAVDTLSRLPDRERVWLSSAERAAWPQVIHTPQEHYEAELQRIVELKEEPEKTKLRRLAVTDPTAINRMLVALDWLRFVTAYNFKNIKRDKKIVLALASGQSESYVARWIMGARTPQAAHHVKNKVVGQIALALKSSCNL